MTAPPLLAAYALLAATVAGPVLARALWVNRAPAVGVLAWQAVTGSLVASVVLAGVALAVPTLPVTASIAEFLHACSVALAVHYSTPAGATAGTAGLVVAAAVTARLLYCLVREVLVGARARRRQRRTLRLVAHRHSSGSWVLPHATPAVYCIPGRRSRRTVVVTTGALEQLDDAELDAALAHEHGHLVAHHHAALTVAAALEAAFGFLRVFGLAHEQQRRLLEMHADDMAARDSGQRTLATTLVRLATGQAPTGALAASGEATVLRVRRLLDPARPLGRLASVGAGAAALAVFVAPFVVAAAPGIVAMSLEYCPIKFPA